MEKSTNQQYVVNTERKTVQIISGDNNITVGNKKKSGYIEINKYDAENTSKKLSNIKFGIYDEQSNLIEELTTNSNGYAKSSALSLDKKYVVKEISSIQDYELNTTTWNVNLAENGYTDGFVYTLNVGNKHEKGNIVIYKVDEEDNSIVIKDSTFEIYDAQNNKIVTIRTNENGVARLDNINTGTYTILEKESNQYYRLDTSRKTLEVRSSKVSGDYKITITNKEKKGYIEIDKFDKENPEIKLPNVLFEILDTNGNKIQELTTDARGYCKSMPLSLKKQYIVREIQTTDEYITNTTEWRVNLTENGIVDNFTYTLRIANEHKKGNLKIEKINADNKKIGIGNVEFELYLVNGNNRTLKGKYYTDINGEIYIEKLNTGPYVLKETKTNRWFYLADDTEIEVKWSEQFGDTKVTIENEQKKGKIQVIKTDSDFNEYKLENVEFAVYDENNTLVETIKTNSEGLAETSRLKIDKSYYFYETSTKTNYILDDTIHKIDFTEGLTNEEINDIQNDTIRTINLQNTHKKGSLKVYKVDNDNNEIAIENAKFELYAKNVDAPYMEDELIGTYLTDSNGEINIDNLWTGEYYLKEISVSPYYILDSTEIPVVITEDEQAEIVVENQAKQGYIRVEKQDSEFNDIKLSGIIFAIFDEDNHIVERMITDENGICQSSLLPIEKKYYLVEERTDNLHAINTERIEIDFTKDLTEDDIAEIEKDIEYGITIENDAKTASLQIIKIDRENDTVYIPDTEFEIYDETLDEVIGKVTTDEEGKATIENLKVTHTYSIKETKSNIKYKLNEAKITNIELLPEELNRIAIYNERIKGQVRVIKIDKDNNSVLIPNVEFYIVDSNMNVVDTITTDETGTATSIELPAVDETYYIFETRTDDLYVLSEEVKQITLTENEITDIVFENELKKGTITITKVDSKDEEIKLSGATFEIYNSDLEIVDTVTTKENGECTSIRLPIGTYYIKEVDTGSPYYLLNYEVFVCGISENDENVLMQIVNESVDIDVTVEKEGDTETKPGEMVNYTFSNISNASNVELDSFKWIDYIPTDYVRVSKMTTGVWSQDLYYDVYYKTNKSDEYVLFKAKLHSFEEYELDFSETVLNEDEYITEICYDFGKVEMGFSELEMPTMQCKAFDYLLDGECFTNLTKTIGTYFGLYAERESKWTTIVHIPEEVHEPVLPRTGA